MRADDHDVWRDDLAERRRERDRGREPRGMSPRLADLSRRHRAEAHRLDLINAMNDTSIVALECPACGGPVFATAAGDRIDCANEDLAGPCGARLVTVQTAEGVVAVLEPGGAP